MFNNFQQFMAIVYKIDYTKHKGTFLLFQTDKHNYKIIGILNN